jgi:hypothetical protein
MDISIQFVIASMVADIGACASSRLRTQRAARVLSAFQ